MKYTLVQIKEKVYNPNDFGGYYKKRDCFFVISSFTSLEDAKEEESKWQIENELPTIIISTY